MVEMREWEIRPRREGGIQEKLRGLGSWEKRDQSSVQRSEQRAKGLVAQYAKTKILDCRMQWSSGERLRQRKLEGNSWVTTER